MAFANGQFLDVNTEVKVANSPLIIDLQIKDLIRQELKRDDSNVPKEVWFLSAISCERNGLSLLENTLICFLWVRREAAITISTSSAQSWSRDDLA